MEAGQGVELIKDIPNVKELIYKLLVEFDSLYKKIKPIEYG